MVIERFIDFAHTASTDSADDAEAVKQNLGVLENSRFGTSEIEEFLGRKKRLLEEISGRTRV
jgi:hypothetical protein